MHWRGWQDWGIGVGEGETDSGIEKREVRLYLQKTVARKVVGYRIVELEGWDLKGMSSSQKKKGYWK